jgi:molybdenum cofactor cytidylyltransferase
MGANKLLLEVDGKSVIEHILISLSPIETMVVLGHKPHEIQKILQRHKVRAVLNPEYHKGMITSVQVGIKKIAHTNVEAVYLVLGDSFGFSKNILYEMEIVLKNNPSILIVSPVFDGKRGHPVLFRRKLFKEILELKEFETLKMLFDRFEKKHRFVSGDIWTIIDLDTPKDYEMVKNLWKNR